MKKTWSWSIPILNLGTHRNQTDEQIQKFCRSAGLAGLEGWGQMLDGKSDDQVEAMGKSYTDARIPFTTFHLPFSPDIDLASFYESSRCQAVDTIRRWMDRSSMLGSKVGIQHPSASRCDVNVEGVDPFLRQLGKSLETLLPHAESLGYILAIENMGCSSLAETRFGSQPEHFERIIKAFDHPNLGFCLDAGHALLAMGPQRAHEVLDVMGDRLRAFHLADNAGDRDSHLAPGHGLVDWTPIFRQAARLAFSGPICIETPPFAPGPDYGVDAFRKMLADTDSLVEKALA